MKEFEISKFVTSNNWKRCSIFHVVENQKGGSMTTPVGRIELIKKSGDEYSNPHDEIRVILRNDVKVSFGFAKILKKPRRLNKVSNIISESKLREIIDSFMNEVRVNKPYCVYVTMESVTSFNTIGDFYIFDQ